MSSSSNRRLPLSPQISNLSTVGQFLHRLPSAVTSFLSFPQQIILAELCLYRKQFTRLCLASPNYTQLRTWGKTRLCLSLCLADIFTAMAGGGAKWPRFVVITDTIAELEMWAREWREFMEHFSARGARVTSEVTSLAHLVSERAFFHFSFFLK